ncbi:MAG: prolipoprotein diacylglyceryl transferase [Candidatus Pacearchaeota archaeon]
MIYITPSTELFNILGYSVQTWGLIVAFGGLISLFLVLRKAKQKNIFNEMQTLIVYIIIASLVCARLAYIIINPSEFSSFWSFFEIWKGGVISYGMIFGGILGIIFFKLFTKITTNELEELLDLAAPYFILAIAIGRIGCFLRGCCFGLPSELPWAVVYAGESFSRSAGLNSVHPTQIYHSILDFIIFIILLRINKKKEYLEKRKQESKFDLFNKKGSTFLLFLLLYSAERFFIDFLRWHSPTEYIGRITITQIIFLFIFVVTFSILLKKKNKKRKKQEINNHR